MTHTTTTIYTDQTRHQGRIENIIKRLLSASGRVVFSSSSDMLLLP
nr:MAG TPA: hypothetical protein [Bacteriophage sp.]